MILRLHTSGTIIRTDDPDEPIVAEVPRGTTVRDAAAMLAHLGPDLTLTVNEGAERRWRLARGLREVRS